MKTQFIIFIAILFIHTLSIEIQIIGGIPGGRIGEPFANFNELTNQMLSIKMFNKR